MTTKLSLLSIKKLHLSLLVALSILMGALPAQAEPTAQAEPLPGRIENRQFGAVEINQMQPFFTQDTVLKLNAIVRRSLTAADAYAEQIKNIRESVATVANADASEEALKLAASGVEKVNEWHSAANAAMKEMDAAAKALRASDEVFNENLLAGMIAYCHKVEAALEKESASLAGTLAANSKKVKS